MIVCVLTGTGAFFAIFAGIGITGKIWHDGIVEAGRGFLRAVQDLSAFNTLRLTVMAAILSLISGFPVYAREEPMRHPAMIASAVLAALVLSGYFSFEHWYAWGYRDLPPPGLVLALVGTALAGAYLSRFLLGLRGGRQT